MEYAAKGNFEENTDEVYILSKEDLKNNNDNSEKNLKDTDMEINLTNYISNANETEESRTYTDNIFWVKNNQPENLDFLNDL